jgi:dTDP-4-amino-4,6-dideoxygalactose transaminase
MIPIFELTRQYQKLKPELEVAIGRVLSHGVFSLGNEVRLFEEEFADYLDIYHAVGVGSGTDALTLAIRALDIKPNEEVIIPANSYPTVFGVALAGVKIKLVDCAADGNIDLAKLDAAVTSKTKAVILVHLYGSPVDVIRVKILLNNRKLPTYIIEDAAQAHGAALKDASGWRKVGTIGDIGCISFYPSKNLGAYGDGGMVVTDKSSVAKKLKALRMYGETSRYVSEMVSGVSRLDELQAAILRVKLLHLDEWVSRRIEIAQYYTRELNGVGDIVLVNPEGGLQVAGGREKQNGFEKKSAYHLFVIRAGKRDKLQKYLADQGIGTGIHYPIPIHLTKSFAYLGYKKGDFPEAETMCREVLSLPIYPELTNNEIEEVVKKVKGFYK